jgi:hypothetical protein
MSGDHDGRGISSALDYSNPDPARFKRQKRRSKEQEQRIAKQTDGKRSSTSGAVKGTRSGYSPTGISGDVTASERGFKVEAKYTDKKSYRIDEETVVKVMLEAEDDGLDWVIQVDIHGFDSSSSPKSFAVLDWDTFLRITEQHE